MMYQPTQDLLAGLRNAFLVQLFPWDDYFPRMAETDFLAGRGETLAAKSFFIRRAPFGGPFVILGGITDALRSLEDLALESHEFRTGMLDMGYLPEFVRWLASRRRLRLKIYAPPEGNLIFPNEPVITAFGPLPDLRLFEGILTEAVNFPTLSLTKWNRLVRVVRPGRVLEFSRRRAQNALKTTLYAILAGCSFTSNSEARRFFDVSVIGTMGHEWVQSFGDVPQAFDVWLTHQPKRPVGLVDTLQCMQHDFPAWLDAVYKHRAAIKTASPAFWGWRDDSGDLAYLAIEQYLRCFRHPIMQDPWFVEKMAYILTNELDEYTAVSIIQQIRTNAGQAGFDFEDIIGRAVWAAGTRPGVCEDQPSLGGVAKLMECEGYACIKLAFDSQGNPGEKTSIPGLNLSAVIRDENGEMICLLIFPQRKYRIVNSQFQDVISGQPLQEIVACHPDNPGARMRISDYTAAPQQKLVWDSLGSNGFTSDWEKPTILSVAEHIRLQVDSLHWTMTRIDSPHSVKVSLTEDLFELRQAMITQGVLREDKLI